MQIPSSRKTFQRVFVIILLVLFAIQFELGMAVNLAPTLQNTPAFRFSIQPVMQALQSVGFVAMLHAGNAILLLILALINMITSLTSRVRMAQVFGTLGFISTVLAAYGGIAFTLSGFQDDGFSHAMASNFILAFIFYFLELYGLKG